LCDGAASGAEAVLSGQAGEQQQREYDVQNGLHRPESERIPVPCDARAALARVDLRELFPEDQEREEQRYGGHRCQDEYADLEAISAYRVGCHASIIPEHVGCDVVLETRLDLDRIRAARRVIDPVFLDSPLYRCEALEPVLGCALSIKLETANPVRSFKGRGTEVVADQLARGDSRAVVCASAGNLGQALAWSGRHRDLDVTVVASRFATPAKLDRIRAFGATLELVDGDHELARDRAAAIARYDGIRLLEDSLDLETCEGAATIALELLGPLHADAPPPYGNSRDRNAPPQYGQSVRDRNALPPYEHSSRDTSAPYGGDRPAVLVALGGGAMATGVGYVLKALAPHAEAICVQPLGAPAMTRSWHQRRVVTTDSTDTIADGVAGRRPIPEVLADLLVLADDAVLVQESSIITALRLLHDHAGLVAEPSAGLGIAAILEAPARFAGREVTTIICGSNVDPAKYRSWI
jgi:threonine dehydratase